MLVLRLNWIDSKWESWRSEVSQAEAGGGEGAQERQWLRHLGAGRSVLPHLFCGGVQREEAPPTRVSLGGDLCKELDGSSQYVNEQDGQRRSKGREG